MQVSIQSCGGEPNAVTSFAGSELRQYIGRGKLSDDAPEVLALSVVNQLGAAAPSPPVHDGYCLTWSDTRLELKAAKPKGLLNGVYDILGLLGFAFPFPELDRYPSKQNWSAVKANADGRWRIPSFRHRILHFDNMRLTPEIID